MFDFNPLYLDPNEDGGDLAGVGRGRAHQPKALFALDGRILEANAAFLKLYGYRASELWGCNRHSLQAPGAAEGLVHDALWASLAAGWSCRGEYGRQRRDGTVFRLLESYLPLTGGGAVRHVLSIGAPNASLAPSGLGERTQIECGGVVTPC